MGFDRGRRDVNNRLDTALKIISPEKRRREEAVRKKNEMGPKEYCF